MDPFHVVRLGGEALDKCRRRVQLDTCGHRGRKTDPLYAARRTLQTGADLLTDKQKDRLTKLFAVDTHIEVEATWGIYQRMISAYRNPDRRNGRLEHLRGSALGFRNLTHYITRSLLETGGFKPRLHPRS